MDNLLIELQGKVHLSCANVLRKSLDKTLSDNNVPQAIYDKIHLCISEAVTNLVVHTDIKPEVIILRFGDYELNRLGVPGKGCWIEITDDSPPWDPTEHYDDNLLAQFSDTENGRGTALINTLADEISYHSDNDNRTNKTQNTLRLSWQYPHFESRKTILLVDDEQCLLAIYQKYLTDTFNVITATNAAEALAILSSSEVDLILSDIKMPNMSGFTFRKTLNSMPKHQLTPFIFLSSSTDQLTFDQATALGIDDYLVKPIEQPLLVNSVLRVIKRSHQIKHVLTNRIDESISASLQPQVPPKLHNWRLASANRNTGKGGGDLLLHNDNNEQINILLADIMGHDDNAKFFAHACSGYLHGLLGAKQENMDESYPTTLLNQLSDFAFSDQIMSQITLTSCAMQLSAQGLFSIASAGHPAPLHIRSTGLYPLPASGTMLGLLPETTYETTDYKINSGERIAVFTDGLFDSAESNEEREQLKQAIYDSLYQSLNFTIEEALHKTMAVFDRLTNNKPTDDALLILIEPDD